MKKETWSSKMLLILAVAGGAIGIGNFLRFPTLFAQYGGWFLVPYFVSFFLLGLPLMLVEWVLGVMAGEKEKHSLSFLLYETFKNKRQIKYLGIIAVACCLIVSGYYLFIESWMLGYAVLSIKGAFNSIDVSKLGDFLGAYIGFQSGTETTVISIIVILITVFLNFYFVIKGISKGVAVLIKWCMPLLLIMAILILIKVLFTPNIIVGIRYMFRGDISQLMDPKMWVAAASQMFFSLSVGFTATMVYVTYSKNNLNIFKDGMSAAFLNMGTEVLFAAFMTIPISVLVFGDKMDEVAKSSSIAFGMVAMPSVFQNIPGASLLCFLWFILLFIAALTSSISMIQVYQAFILENSKIGKAKSTLVNLLIFASVLFASILIPVAVDEFDFWTNTILMPIGGLILIFIVHLLKSRFLDAFNNNSKIKCNLFIEILIKYITPLYLLLIIIPFIIINIKEFLVGKDITLEHWMCRIIIMLVLLFYSLVLKCKINKK